METYLKTLYDVAEDVVRLDPWHRRMAPFVFQEDDRYFLVAFETHKGSRSIRFYHGDPGARAYFLMEEAPDHVLGRVAEWTAAVYWEVVDQPFKMTDWEREIAADRDRALAFRSKKAHLPPEAMSKKDSARVLVYLRALRKMLSQDKDQGLQRVSASQGDLRLPAFDLGREGPMEPVEVLIRPFVKAPDLAPVVDEFTAARLRFAPIGEDRYELFFFYLPIITDNKAQPYFMVTAFLVNLTDGVIEWSDVLPQSPRFRQVFLGKLFTYWLDQGFAPAGILCSKRHFCEALGPDLRQAGIPLEKIAQSYVGEELSETYMSSSRIKPGHYESLLVPSL